LKYHMFMAVAALAAAGCHRESDKQDGQQAQSADAGIAALRFEDARPQGAMPPALPNLGIEVALDRAGFSSGVIDGKATRFDRMALKGFQLANGLEPTGKPDARTMALLPKVSATRTVRVPEAFARGPFVPDLPKQTGKQAGFDHLGYRDLSEALAERFHTTPETLAALNPPGAAIGAGSVIQVPDVADIDATKLGADERGWNATLATLAVAPDQPRAEKVVVSKSGGWLRAYDGSGKLLVQFPATMGSEHDPLPIGHWKILGVSKNPDFHYNPKLFWDVKDSEKEHLLKPGPNGPVGVVWLDLSKEHYGIHGTGEPSSIGNSESHGCVRLTNWDAARLAQMVKAGTQVVFQR